MRLGAIRLPAVRSDGAASITGGGVVDLRIDVLRGAVPALVLLAVSAVLIHAICRRPPFSRLTLALSLGVFAGCLALFHTLVEGTEWLGPYDLVLGLFALAYTGSIARGRAQVSAGPPGGPGAPRSATCRTLEDGELLILPKEALRPLLVNDPAAAERLSQAMARRTSSTRRRRRPRSRKSPS
jgi:CRP-like cAMP-binding protein